MPSRPRAFQTSCLLDPMPTRPHAYQIPCPHPVPGRGFGPSDTVAAIAIDNLLCQSPRFTACIRSQERSISGCAASVSIKVSHAASAIPAIAIRGHQRPSEGIRGIRGHQGASGAIRGYQGPSGVIRGHQGPSEAIRGHQRVSGGVRGYQGASEGISELTDPQLAGTDTVWGGGWCVRGAGDLHGMEATIPLPGATPVPRRPQVSPARSGSGAAEEDDGDAGGPRAVRGSGWGVEEGSSGGILLHV